jgi:Phosphotransferase enzyme family
LPTPPEGMFGHLVLLGGATSLADRLVDLGVARRVSRTIPGEPSADAVAILHDAEARLDDVRACLLPGGVLYWEIGRRRLTAWLGVRPAGIRRRLREAGFAPGGVYWLRPDFAHCRLYLPVEVEGAIRWYVDTQFAAVSLRRRALASILRASAGAVRRLPLPATCYAVTATAAPPHRALPALLTGAELPLSSPRRDLRLVVLSRTRDDDVSRRVIAFPFAPRGTQPLAVLKFWRVPGRNAETEREQSVMVAIRRSLDETMRRAVPEPLGTFKLGPLTVGVESYARGRSLAVSSARRDTPVADRIADLDLVVIWLSEFHRQGDSARAPLDDVRRSQWVEAPLEAYAKSFGTEVGEDRLFAEVRRRAASLLGVALPSVWVHRDLNPWNVIRDGRDLTIIDWAGARAGPPLLDLLYLVTCWSHAARGLTAAAARLEDFRALFLGRPRDDRRDTIVDTVHRAIDRYLARIEIDRRFLPMLLAVLWVTRAVERRDPTQAVAYVRVLAEDPARLFTDAPWSP